jgi:hypothetical protein
MAKKKLVKKAQNTTVLLKNSGGLDCAGYYKTSMFKSPYFKGWNKLFASQR